MLELTPRHVALPKRAKYLQLADAIRQAIADEFLQPGEDLPSEGKLAAMIDSSKAVVRQALEALESEGLIQRRNGVPVRVTPASKVRVLSDERYLVEAANILAGNRTADSAFSVDHGIDWDKYRIDLEIRREVASPKDRAMLQLEEGQQVFRRCFVKYAGVDDKGEPADPVEIQRSAIPEFVAGANPEMIDPARQPPYGGTQRELAYAGYRPTRVTTRVKPRMPTENEQRDLRIARVPVLDVERIFWHGDTPVEASRLVLPGPRHELYYETTLPD